MLWELNIYQIIEQVQRRAAIYVTNRYHNTSSALAMLEQVQRRAAIYVINRYHNTSSASAMLEQVQRRAAIYVTNRYHNTSSASAMLNHLQWPTLEHRRSLSRIAMLYKITNNLIAVDPKRYLTPQPSLSTRNNNPLQYQIISTRTNYYKYIFPPTCSSTLELTTLYSC